jgi:hypothetical protein
MNRIAFSDSFILVLHFFISPPFFYESDLTITYRTMAQWRKWLKPLPVEAARRAGERLAGAPLQTGITAQAAGGE